MKRPPMKKTVTSKVARICASRSCVRERISRNVQMMRLNQKMTRKATTKPITIPKSFVRVVNVLLVDDVVVVAVAVGPAVGVAAGANFITGLEFSIVRICAIFVIIGPTPLSGNPIVRTLHYNVSYGKTATQ